MSSRKSSRSKTCKEKFVVTAAFPNVPANLHLGHFISTYVPADIQYRLLKIIGKDAYLISGTDALGFKTLRKAKEMQVDTGLLVEEYHRKYLEQFNKLLINYSSYIINSGLRVEKLVKKSLAALKNNKKIKRKKVSFYFCSNCKLFIPRKVAKRDRGVDVKCNICNNRLTLESSFHKALILADESNIFEYIINGQDEYVRRYSEGLIRSIPEYWVLTRKYYFGLQSPLSKDEQIYVWYASFLSYVAGAEDAIKHNKNCNLEEVYWVHFFGKNIIFYHAVIWPLILRYGFNIKRPLLKLRVKGLVFPDSSSRVKATDPKIWERLVENIEPDYIRFFAILHNRKGLKDAVVRIEDFNEVINSRLIYRIYSVLHRIIGILRKNNIKRIKFQQENRQVSLYTKFLKSSVLSLEPMETLDTLFKIVRDLNSRIEKNRMFVKLDSKDADYLILTYGVIVLFLSAFCPKTAELFKGLFGQFNLETLEDFQNIYKAKLSYNVPKIQKVNLQLENLLD